MKLVGFSKAATRPPRRRPRLRLLCIRRSEGVRVAPHLARRPDAVRRVRRLHRVLSWVWWRPHRVMPHARRGTYNVPPLTPDRERRP